MRVDTIKVKLTLSMAHEYGCLTKSFSHEVFIKKMRGLLGKRRESKNFQLKEGFKLQNYNSKIPFPRFVAVSHFEKRFRINLQHVFISCTIGPYKFSRRKVRL